MTTVVSFDRVSFSYPGARTPVFSEVCLEIPEGVFVLVAGATGAGKSPLPAAR